MTIALDAPTRDDVAADASHPDGSPADAPHPDGSPAVEPRHPWLRLTLGTAGRVWLWFLAGCLIVTLLPFALGWRPFVVRSGSMEPRIGVGDVVLASPVDAESELLGRVIVFEGPDGESVTHRAVARRDDGTFVTRGDANQSDDSSPVSLEQVVGQGRLLVRFVGLPVTWLHAGEWEWFGAAIGSVVLALALVALDAERTVTSRRSPRRVTSGAAMPVTAAELGVRLDEDWFDVAWLDDWLRGGRPRAGRPVPDPKVEDWFEAPWLDQWLAVEVPVPASTAPSPGRARLGLAARVSAGLLGLAGLTVPTSSAALTGTTTSTVSTWAVAADRGYDGEVVALGPYLYWRLDEDKNVEIATDSSGAGRTGVYEPRGNHGMFRRLTDGALPGNDPNLALGFRHKDACLVSDATQSAATLSGPVSMVAWFRTTPGYRAGGKVLGFEPNRVGTSTGTGGAPLDRVLFMDGAGRLHAGVNAPTPTTVSSALAYNDGAWHMAAVTVSATATTLYVDGVAVASAPATASAAVTGWWRVGCGNLAGWGGAWSGGSNPGTSATATALRNFGADVDEVAVFHGVALGAADVARLYASR